MVLSLQDAEKFKGIETDVRETAVPDEIVTYYNESTAAQTITNAAGWADITGVTRTLTITDNKTVVIFSSVQAELPAGEDKVGLSIRVDIDGTAKTNSTRKTAFELKTATGTEEVRPLDDTDTSVTVSTQYVETLSSGSHTIKIQASGQLNGTSGWAVSLASGNSNMAIMAV